MARRRIAKLAVVLLLIAIVVVMWFSPLRDQLTRENIRAAVDHVRTLWYAPIVFVILFGAACVVALPASLFVIAAGFIWGWLIGGLYSLVGGILGASVAFFAGRFVGEGLLHRFGRVGTVVAKQVDHAGFWSLLAIRNIPGIPFAVLNYGAGVAGVKFRDFFFSTLIGMAPSMFVFTYCADALFNGSMTEADAFRRLAIVCGLVLAVVLLPMGVKRLVRKPAPAVE